MAKSNDHSCGYILPTNVVDIAMCYIDISFALNSMQTLIGGNGVFAFGLIR